MKKIMFLTLTLIFVCGALLAQTNAPKDRSNPRAQTEEIKAPNPERPMQKCLEELKLTDAQKKKWEELKISFEKNKNTLQAEIENLRIDLQKALKDENYQRAKELNKQIASKRNALADAKVNFLADRIKELTPEQKATLKKNMPQFQGGMHKQKFNKNAREFRYQHKENCAECEECGSFGMPEKRLPPKK